jgi:hypothetical protein
MFRASLAWATTAASQVDTAWVRTYDGNLTGELDTPVDHAVNGDGNVYVTGESEVGGYATFSTLQYDCEGHVLWEQQYLGATPDDVFAGADPPAGYSYIDVNGDCDGTVLDLLCLIEYVFRGGPAPVEGCVK